MERILASAAMAATALVVSFGATVVPGTGTVLGAGPASAATVPSAQIRLRDEMQRRTLRVGGVNVELLPVAEAAIALGVSVCRHASAGATPGCGLFGPAVEIAEERTTRPDRLFPVAGGPGAGWPLPSGGVAAGPLSGALSGPLASVLPAAPRGICCGGGGAGGGSRSDLPGPAAGGDGTDPANGPDNPGPEGPGETGNPVVPPVLLPVPLAPSALFALAALAILGGLGRLSIGRRHA